MNRKLFTLVLIFLLLSAKVSATEFGIGGAFSMGNSFTQVGFSTGFMMSFHTKQNPVIWEISVGSSNRINEQFNPFTTKMRFEWHILNWNFDNVPISAFFGPGLGFEFQVGGDEEASTTYKKAMIGLGSTIALRIIGGFKIFVNEEVELFMSVSPEIGVTHKISWALDKSGTIDTNVPEFHWAVDTSLGVRFWMI